MTTAVDYTRHTQIRDRIRSTLETLKSEGIERGELIECLGNELHILKLEDQREFEASTDSLTRSGADLLPATEQQRTIGDKPIMQLNSGFFQTVADLLRHIEGLGVASDQYGILDGGGTLELSTALRERIKETNEFKAFESIGGNHYCYDDDSWTVEGGISAKAIANLFEV